MKNNQRNWKNFQVGTRKIIIAGGSFLEKAFWIISVTGLIEYFFSLYFKPEFILIWYDMNTFNIALLGSPQKNTCGSNCPRFGSGPGKAQSETFWFPVLKEIRCIRWSMVHMCSSIAGWGKRKLKKKKKSDPNILKHRAVRKVQERFWFSSKGTFHKLMSYQRGQARGPSELSWEAKNVKGAQSRRNARKLAELNLSGSPLYISPRVLRCSFCSFLFFFVDGA